MLLTLYYFACAFYAIARSYKKWMHQDMGANTMELIMILAIGWLLSPIDFAIISYKHFHIVKEDYKIDNFKIDKDDIY